MKVCLIIYMLFSLAELWGISTEANVFFEKYQNVAGGTLAERHEVISQEWIRLLSMKLDYHHFADSMRMYLFDPRLPSRDEIHLKIPSRLIQPRWNIVQTSISPSEMKIGGHLGLVAQIQAAIDKLTDGLTDGPTDISADN